MAAILGLEDDRIDELCKQSGAEPANYNAPGQIVIAGTAEAVAAAVKLLQTDAFKGGKAIPLQVSAPFHCSLMKPARDRMAAIFQKTPDAERPHALRCPYVPNRTARPTAEAGVVLDLLVEQIDHAVLWKQSIEALIRSGHSRGIEFGPGKVLAGLAKRISKTVGQPLEILNLETKASLAPIETALKGSA
jgi:[acyl-carrier-protein] S-malonyltransferase